MKSKVGFHVDIQGHQGQLEKMARAEARVIKVITSMGMLRDLHHRLGSKTIFIARDWKVDDDFLRFGGQNDPKGAARRWLEGMRPAIVQAPFAYWESFNEMSNWDFLRHYGEFEAERQRLMAAEGFRCCIGNFAVGTPAVSNSPDDRREDKWADFYPALEAAHRFKNILGLHEYGGLWMDLWYGPNQTDAVLAGRRVPFPETREEGWLFGRYRKVWRRHIQPNNWTDIRIALTEFGLDGVGQPVTQPLAGYPLGSWTSCRAAWERLDGRRDAEQYYVEQLQWADRQMQKDPYVLGAAIFTWGTLGTLWRDFEIEGPVADKLIAYIESTRHDPVPDDVNSTTSTAPTVPTVFLTPIPVDGLWLRTGPGIEHPVVGRVHPGDKLGAVEPESEVLARLGKADQWVRIRTSADVEGYVAAWLVERFGTTPIDTTPSAEKVYVIPIYALGVELFDGPGTQFERIDKLYMGDQLELLEPSPEVIGSIGKPGAWLKVRSPRAMNGWVEARLVQRTYVGPHRDAPDPEPDTPLYLRTTADTGLYIRSGPGAHYNPVASVFRGDRLEVVGSTTTARTLLGQRGQWIQVRTPRGQVGWASAFYLEIMPPYYEWPVGHALAGLHGPADPGEWPWDEVSFQLVKKSRMQAVKLLAAADIGGRVVNRLRQEGVQFIMARLFARFTEPRSPESFVEEVADAALRLYDQGIRYFEVHNEPNLHSADAPEGMWVVWQNGNQFSDFFLKAVARLRHLLPGAQFGFPGVSPGGDVPGLRADSEIFLQQAGNGISKADFVGMHVYWGADGSSYVDAINKVRAFCDRYPTKLIMVTEFSNSHPHIGKDIKGREYAAFYTEAKKLPRNLGALFSYLLSSSSGFTAETWKGSPIVDAVGGRPQS